MNSKIAIETKAMEKKSGDFAAHTKEIHSAPLTYKQLSERLKHIASLCWGLSIDIQNEIELRKELEAENKRLIAEFENLTGKKYNRTLISDEELLAMPPERRAHILRSRARTAKQRAAKESQQ